MNQVKISKGNAKGNFPNVSLRPVLDCGNVPCRKDCYACKAYRMYPSAKAAWDSNSKIARSNPDRFFDGIAKYLSGANPKWFRWHVAGDILNKRYLAGMVKLAKQFPAVRFLAFTKRFDLLPAISEIPANLSIVASLWPGWGKAPKGYPIAYMQDGTENRIPAKAIHCPGNCDSCGMCWALKDIKRDVWFTKH